ncbi:Periplasmic nitrate reductase [Streptomyces violaceorubidus]
MGSNPVVSAPRAAHVEERLRSLDFLAVCDVVLSETAELADVVLPVTQWAEETGTTTSLEGRVLLRRRAITPPDGVRSDLEVLHGLAGRLGVEKGFPTEPEEVFEELRRASAGGPADYSGIGYRRLAEENGVFWPCPAPAADSADADAVPHPGSPRLFLDRFATDDGRARFVPVAHRPSAEEPDDEYPVLLTTGRVVAQSQSGAQTRTYGDGTAFGPLVSLDVAGHEMSHGVTSKTAALTYSGESGGLNEATSDIFGALVEWHADSSADPGDYLIGEKVVRDGFGRDALRYLDRPSRDGSSADCWSTSLGDLDVHYSSGVANHFAYLLAEGSGARTVGGVAYDSPTCDGSTVSGIGRDKLGDIWYRALTVYMTSSTDYAGARAATLSAAGDLYGTGSAEYAAVGAAWSAVDVG